MPAIVAASATPSAESQVRIVMPCRAACAPISARATCARTSQTSSWPGCTSNQTPSRLAIEPVGAEQAGLVAEQLRHPLPRGR